MTPPEFLDQSKGALVLEAVIFVLQTALVVHHRLQVRREKQLDELRKAAAKRAEEDARALREWRQQIDDAVAELRKALDDVPSTVASKIQADVGNFELVVEKRLRRIEELVTRYDERIRTNFEADRRIEHSIELLNRRLDSGRG